MKKLAYLFLSIGLFSTVYCGETCKTTDCVTENCEITDVESTADFEKQLKKYMQTMEEISEESAQEDESVPENITIESLEQGRK
jgi:hypothetical protein